ncbi:Imm70 family immunity protein [Pedosphaera parvula]|uniref:Uncharacterized protein n=1 Tax=Pedosphaera parvula (strain Ellin514) TaxID=320771 RepID=B9XKD2_PEDPL|nr:Imm70 family immunity protein [Pedosphaera parvula]EEF59770.1 hypothetical protein Cflav_PD2591 [Pedosphaera parvula Ellin514]
MSLYLCVFDEDDEIDGLDVGAYSDFAHFRNTIAQELEEGRPGTRFPTLMLHSDCDGEWKPDECLKLSRELEIIASELKQRPPREFHSEWQKGVVKKLGLTPLNLYDCFIDVDGEPILERLARLVETAKRRQLPILFQ